MNSDKILQSVNRSGLDNLVVGVDDCRFALRAVCVKLQRATMTLRYFKPFREKAGQQPDDDRRQ
jgi:hypothetical protein